MIALSVRIRSGSLRRGLVGLRASGVCSSRPTYYGKPERSPATSRLALFIESTENADEGLTAVHQGLRYELQVCEVLEEKGLRLLHTGQAADGGVDLRGKWAFPDGQHMDVVIQCKCTGKRLGPKYIRELEGSLLREAAGTVGLLVSPIGYTPQALRHINTASFPLALVQLNEGGGLEEFQANAPFMKLAPRLIVGVGMKIDAKHRQCQLLYNLNGNPIPL